MAKQPNLCVVCGKSEASGGYGVTSCDSCKEVYRRSLSNAPKKCSRGRICLNCKFCKLRQCIQAGMGSPTPWSSHPIQQLEILHNFREHNFLNYTFPENLDLEEFIHSKSVNYIQTSAYSQSMWTRTNLFTSIDFIRKFEVVRKLSTPEIEDFVKQSYLPVSMFFIAWNSYQNGKKYAEFPGEMDIISDELKTNHYQEENVHKIRCILVEKLTELEVKKEEFLLLNAIIVCDPATPHLTEEHKSGIENDQNRYLSLLLKHCLQNHQKNGPSRFANLLTILNTIKIVVDAYEKVSKSC